MSKKVLVISSSLRKNANSEQLALSFADGARKSGHEVEVISLRDKEIRFCIGCFACQKTQRCFMHDDADAIREKMLHADVLVFATPSSVKSMHLQRQQKMRNMFRKRHFPVLRAG